MIIEINPKEDENSKHMFELKINGDEPQIFSKTAMRCKINSIITNLR